MLQERVKFLTKVKLAEFGQPEPSEIWPVGSLIKNYETTKSYKITEKPNKISQYFWLKRALWFGFSFTLTLKLAFYLYIEKQHKQKRKKLFFSDISKAAIWSYLKKTYI